LSGRARTPEFESHAEARARVAAGLAGVERVLCVMSGKGGVGKSAVAVHLALAFAQRGARVGLLDADLQGPSLAKMLGLRGRPLAVRSGALLPVAGPGGLAVQSMDFLLQGSQALDWDGPAGEGAVLRSALEHAALADLLAETRWGRLDLLIADLPPGADRLPALAQLVPGCEALAVTIPSEVALLAVERSLRRAREARIPLLGLVLNMASHVCPGCGLHAPLYGEARVEALARALDVPVVARIPFERELAEALDAGRPRPIGGGKPTPSGAAFDELALRLAKRAEREENAC